MAEQLTPQTTVGSLVQRLKGQGKTEEEIAKRFEQEFGAPHYNFPDTTTIAQAFGQSPRAIKAKVRARAFQQQRAPRQVAERSVGEELYFSPKETAPVQKPATEFSPLDVLIPSAEAAPPTDRATIEDVGTAGSEEAQMIAEEEQRKQLAEDRAMADKAQSEVVGGITDPMESLKRTWGFLKGAGQYLWEGTPWGEADLISREKAEQTAPIPGETNEAFSARRAQEEFQRKQFEKVVADPKSSWRDVVGATPAFQNLRNENKSVLDRVDTSMRESLRVFAEDAGDFLLFLPRLLSAPFSSFERPKGVPSEEVGRQFGSKFMPGLTAAVVNPQLSPQQFYESFRARPLTTIFTYMPIFEGMGALAKDVPGLGAVGQKAASFVETAGVNFRQSLAQTIERVAKKTGLTSQEIMDRYYNKDPNITLLMEQAFAEGVGVNNAIEKMGQMLGEKVAPVAEQPVNVPGGRPVTVGEVARAAKGLPSGVQQGLTAQEAIAQAPAKLKLSGEQSVKAIQDMAKSMVAAGVEEGGVPLTEAQAVDKITAALAQRDNLLRLQPQKLIDFIDQRFKDSGLNPSGPEAMAFKKDLFDWMAGQSSKGEPANLFPQGLRGGRVDPLTLLPDGLKGTAVERFPEVLRSINAELKGSIAQTTTGTRNAFAMDAKAYAEAVSNSMAQLAEETKLAKTKKVILEAADNRMGGVVETNPEYIFNDLFPRQILPNVLNLTEQELNALKSYVQSRRGGSEGEFAVKLAERLNEMKPMEGVPGAYVSKPIAFLQEEQQALAAMRKSVPTWTRAINTFIKSAKLPANLPSIISNFVGNSVVFSYKFGTNPLFEMGKTLESLRTYNKWLENPANVAPETARALDAATKIGLFGRDAISADLLLYSRALGEEGLISKAQRVTGLNALSKVGGKLMQGGDVGARLRYYMSSFGEMDKWIDSLQPGETITFPEGPNLRTTVEALPDGKFKVTQAAFGRQVKGGKPTTAYAEPPRVESKPLIVDPTVPGELDLLKGRAANGSTSTLVFDYGRAPGFITKAARSAPLVGAESPFFTYAWMGLSAPPFKKGAMNAVLTGTDGVSSTSKAVNADLAAKGLALSMRRALIAGAAQAMHEDPDTRKLYGFDPMGSGVSEVSEMGMQGSVNVQNYSSADWMSGTIGYLGLLEGIYDAVSSLPKKVAKEAGADWAVDPLEKYVKIWSDDTGKYSEKEQEEAWLRGQLELKRLGLGTPEPIPQLFKMTGFGGSMAFKLANKIFEAMGVGKTVDVGSEVAGMLVPGTVGKAYDATKILAANTMAENIPGLEGGKEKLARGVPLGEAIPMAASDRIKLALTQLTGLGSIRVDSYKAAKRVVKAWSDEVNGRLNDWEKKRKLQLATQLGDEVAVEKIATERALLQALLKATVEEWLGGLYLKGVKGFRFYEEGGKGMKPSYNVETGELELKEPESVPEETPPAKTESEIKEEEEYDRKMKAHKEMMNKGVEE